VRANIGPPLRRRSVALRGAALAFVYLLVAQTSLAPLATLRMDPAASIFGVRCLPTIERGAQEGGVDDGRSLQGACCDASCLLQSQSVGAPPPGDALAIATPRRAASVEEGRAERREAREPRSHGPRPQSPRAPPAA
jgi:hypothetical protein